MIARRYSEAAVDALWRRAEGIFGAARFRGLIRAHRQTNPRLRHRLIDQMIRLDDARAGRLTPVAEDAAFVALPEVDSVLTLAEEAKAFASPAAWKEIVRGLVTPGEYLHAVGVVQVASLLRVHHPATEFQITGSRPEPDLILVVTDGLPLAVEVKAPAALWQPATSLLLADARHLIRNTLASAGTVQGQLRAERPGILALSGLLMSQETYDVIVRGFEDHLAVDGRRTPHLLGLAIANLRGRVESGPGVASPLVEQQSVVRRNPTYRGPLHIDDDWARPWSLIQR